MASEHKLCWPARFCLRALYQGYRRHYVNHEPVLRQERSIQGINQACILAVSRRKVPADKQLNSPHHLAGFDLYQRIDIDQFDCEAVEDAFMEPLQLSCNRKRYNA